MMSSFLEIRVNRIEEDGRNLALVLIEPRYNLATKVMSNGVEVIVATDRSIRPGEPEYLRLLSSTVTRPITLAPHTLTNHMSMVLSYGNLKEDENQLFSSLHLADSFVTRTYYTTYAYLAKIVRNGETEFSSWKTTVTNVRTEEASLITPTSTEKIILTESPTFQTEIHHTPYTYLNTLVDGEQPLVATSRRTISNTVTALLGEWDDLEPSEVYPTTSTILKTVDFTKTLTDGTDFQIVSTKDVLTQVVIKNPVDRETFIKPMTTEVTKTYFVTYTYFSTYIDGDKTKVKSDVSVSSDVTIEKFYIKPKTTKFTEKTTSAVSTIPMNIAATRTYLTTFTYFTTLLLGQAGEKAETKVTTRTRVMQNVVRETLSHKHFNEDYLKELQNSLDHGINGKLIKTATLKGGEKMEITVYKGEAIPSSETWLAEQAAPTESNEIQITEQPKPTVSQSQIATIFEYVPSGTASNEIIAEALTSEEDEVLVTKSTTTLTSHANHNIDRTDPIDLKPTKTNVVKSTVQQEEDVSPTAVKKKPVKQPTNDLNFLNLTSLGINGINVLKPVFNAMATLINNNINSKNAGSVAKVDATTTPSKKQASSNVNPLLNFVSGLKATTKAEPKPKATTARAPVYIPVGSFAEDHEVAESQSSHVVTNWLDTQGKNLEKNRIENGIALLEGGIPISPGQVITTNSDVIIGRPGTSGPRPPLFPVKSNIPIDMKPPPPPPSAISLERLPDDVVGQHSTIKNVKPDHREKHKQQHDSGAHDLNPPPAPPTVLTVHRPITINHKPHEIVPYKPDHGEANIIPIPVHLIENYVNVPERDVSVLPEGQIKIASQSTSIGHLNGVPDGGGTSDRLQLRPLLVNIQPSQVANVVIPPGSSTLIINEKHHSLKGEVIDDPSPHPEPETVGFVGAEPVLRLENGDIPPTVQKAHQGNKRRPVIDGPHRPHGGQHHAGYYHMQKVRYEEGGGPEYNHRVKDQSSRMPIYGGHLYRDDQISYHMDRKPPQKVNGGIYVDVSPPGHLPPRQNFNFQQPPSTVSDFSTHQSGLVHDVPLDAQVQLGSASTKDQSVLPVNKIKNKHQNHAKKPPEDYAGDLNPPPPPPPPPSSPPLKTVGNRRPPWSYQSPTDFMVPPPQVSHRPNYKQSGDAHTTPVMIPIGAAAPEQSYPFLRPEDMVIVPQKNKPGGLHSNVEGNDPVRTEDGEELQESNSRPMLSGQVPEELQKTNKTDRPLTVQMNYRPAEINAAIQYGIGRPHAAPNPVAVRPPNQYNYQNKSSEVKINYGPHFNGGVYSEADKVFGLRVQRPGGNHEVSGGGKIRIEATVDNVTLYHVAQQQQNSTESNRIKNKPSEVRVPIRRYPPKPFQSVQHPQENWWITHGAHDALQHSLSNQKQTQHHQNQQQQNHQKQHQNQHQQNHQQQQQHNHQKQHQNQQQQNYQKQHQNQQQQNYQNQKQQNHQNQQQHYKYQIQQQSHQNQNKLQQHNYQTQKQNHQNQLQQNSNQNQLEEHHGSAPIHPQKNQNNQKQTKRPEKPIRDSIASGSSVTIIEDDKEKSKPVQYEATKGNVTVLKRPDLQKEAIQTHKNHATIDRNQLDTNIYTSRPKPSQSSDHKQTQTPIEVIREQIDQKGKNRTDISNTLVVSFDLSNQTEQNTIKLPTWEEGTTEKEQGQQNSLKKLPGPYDRQPPTVTHQPQQKHSANESVWVKQKQAEKAPEPNPHQPIEWPSTKPSRTPTDQRNKWKLNGTNYQVIQLGPNSWHQQTEETHRNRTSPSLVSDIKDLLPPPKTSDVEVMGLSPPPPPPPPSLERPRRPQRPKPPYKFELPTTRGPIAIENDFPPVRSPDFNKKPIKPQDIFPPKLPENFIHPEFPVRTPNPPRPQRPSVTSLPIDVHEEEQTADSNEIYTHEINGHSKPIEDRLKPEKQSEIKPSKASSSEAETDSENIIRGSETIFAPEEFSKYKTPGVADSTERRKMVTTLITTGSTTIFAERPLQTSYRQKTTGSRTYAVIAPTHTTTLTVTTTMTTVIHSVGQKPSTKTIVLTKTILSTVLDKITETQTLVKPTTATVTIATTRTALIVPTPSKSHPGGTLRPEIFVADPHSKDTISVSVSSSMNKDKDKDKDKDSLTESILVVMTNRHPTVNLSEETSGVLLGGVFTEDTRRYKTPTRQKECIPECRATRNERCQRHDGTLKCVCRPGFARMFPDRPCMPTYTYNMRLLLETSGPESTEDQLEYRKLKAMTKEGLDRMIMQSELRDIFHGVSVNGFQTQQKKTMVDFYVQLSENTDEDKLMDVFTNSLRNGNYSLGGTELYAARELATLEAEDFNECLNPKFHDCSENARCFNLRGTYTCSCKEGYTDLSENALFPGRMCSDMIGCEYCGFHGTCYARDDDHITCECFQWYSGDRCRINLKVLLIALVTVGSILLALLLLCGILACLKRRNRGSDATKANGATGYLRYRGPPTRPLDKTAMIAADSSSESSVDNLPYVNHQPPPPPSGTLSAKRKPVLRQVPKGQAPRPESGAVEQQDRSVTVMIPRAKYRPVPPMSPLMTMSTFSPDKHLRRSSQISTEQKLISYLEGNSREVGTSQAAEQKQKNYDIPRTGQAFRKEHRVFEYEYKTSNMQINDGTSSGERKSSKRSDVDGRFRRHSDSTHLHSENSRSFQHRKYSAGALVSAGYEVSATVGLRHDFDISEDEQSGILRTGTMKSNRSQFTTLNRTGDHKTMSEARSYDETTVHPVTRTLKTNYSGSSPSSRVNNDEGHTMVERDIGSTFIMPESHLFKPEQDRGSDLSTFDSL